MEFNLPDGEDTDEAIATMILHLPNQTAHAPLHVFGHGVLKMLANKAAYDKCASIREARKAKQLAEQTANAQTGTDSQESAPNEQPVQNSGV